MVITVNDYNGFVKELKNIRAIPLLEISLENRIERMKKLVNCMFSYMVDNEYDFYLLKCRYIYETIINFFQNNRKHRYKLIPKTSHNRFYRHFKKVHLNKKKLTPRELEIDFYYIYYKINAEINTLVYPDLHYDFTKETTRNVLILTCLDQKCNHLINFIHENL